ncbi:hypothetical protein [Murimonas intestini]|nr:hypothetical protein [Murimonas intestini]MCR1843386.1 hypothetical protein [Murimonas intestini]MCR1868675.1 hypothetical protein [Murimonas intestini]MCR1886359.1 hypothetical protein [Murimonas intestini]
MKEGSDLDMTFSEFVAAYTRDMQPKLKHNTWFTKEQYRACGGQKTPEEESIREQLRRLAEEAKRNEVRIKISVKKEKGDR